MTGGKIAYETLAAILPFPSTSTVMRIINKSSSSIIEGECRFEELKSFLSSRNLLPYVWLSEDATRIVNCIQYDPKMNQLIGFVLPLKPNGMPKSKIFLATSAKVIENHFYKNKPASLLYAIMVQLLMRNSPPFCLCLCGTDNKFNTENVRDHWNFILKGLLDISVTAIGISY